ncbi:DegV family protein [Rossellomorea aquimaris]|uniref:DegV family protein with EDD domain n=1 Tax=Rossellomorea aquimaris TaxID=189382 RepID=A0A366EMQ9_9BACI|nr:DegV family protein [Rossellomorea aquimaris]RBP03641.1 DegV family protein with EDD domain [Rossellomorea aquimaris]
MTVKLFADSASDLPAAYFNQHNIELLPLKVHIDGQDYEDLVTIEPNTVFNKIREGHMPKTSQVSPDLFMKKFTELAESNQPGIYIAFSSQLSGTYQTAVMIRDQVKEEHPALDLTIIDSKCASLGYGLVVMKAAELLQNGGSKEDIVEASRFHSEHMEHLFTVEDLEYLAKGGRVSKASAFLGGLLNIKPLLHVEDGKLVPIEKLRGKKKLLKRILDLMEERGEDLSNQVIAISHGDDEELALEMKKLIQEKFTPKDVYISIIGCAIGSHTGTGTLAIFFLNEHS